MENLSTLEAALLLHIQFHPGKTLPQYTAAMGEPYIKLIHAANTLKQQQLVHVGSDNKFTVNEDHAREENAAISKEFAPENPVVHTADFTSDKEAPVLKPDMDKISPESVLQLLADANGRPRTAGELGAHFGCKGTSLNWVLRKLIENNQVVKQGTTYFIHTEHDVVTHTQPPVETRRILTSDVEVRAVIQNMKDAFTADTCHAEVSKAFIIEKNYFLEVFGDLSMDGYFNVKQDGEYVDPALDFDPNNLHSVRRIMNVEAVATVLDTYSRAVPPPYDLHTIIETERLPHDMVLNYFSHRGFDTGNVRNIAVRAVLNKIIETETAKAEPRSYTVAGIKVVEAPAKPVEKTPVKPEYKKLEDLDLEAVAEYLEGGVRLPVFIKKFELDPLNAVNIRSVLVKLGVAEYVAVTNFLFPKRKESVLGKPAGVTVADIRALEPIPRDPDVEIVIPPSSEELDARKDANHEADSELREASDPVSRLLESITLTAPTGHAAREWTASEKENLVDALHEVFDAEEKAIGVKGECGPGPCPTGAYPDADADGAGGEDEDEKLIEEYCEKMSPIADNILRQVQATKPVNTSSEVSACAPNLHKNGSGSMPNPPNQAWFLTLEMLEQRLTFEHQTRASKQLREIREYLEAL